jgi:CRISPR-associated endonuclease/helicase Cas3
MNALTVDRFIEFYRAVHGREADPAFGPFPWQERLARRVCGGDWPRAVALPTAAGKTTCIDIAVFALACGAKGAPRRIFFVVDRRVVVDQAFLHAEHLMRVLAGASGGILREAADALRALAKDDRPLDVFALRGGMYRETAWARSPLQPTVVATTVDQVGSRLLFRGYGVSDSMRPVHAGLVGNDALILLDEAHCSRPFEQTLRFVDQYRAWGDPAARPPFHFVSLSATPTGDVERAEAERLAVRPDAPPLVERAHADDLAHPVLGPRLRATKPTRLVVAEKAAGRRGRAELVKVLVAQVRDLAAEGFKAVGVIVNRVATARLVARELGAVLLTGRMRPLDRDRVFEERLRPLLSNAAGDPPPFVVGTQCLEVGADLDFHALVTECASLDALRQRFGRLNRVAARPQAKGVVVVRADQADDSADDPVYGPSLAATWHWLRANADGDSFDFGVEAVWAATDGADLGPLSAPAADAPVLFPTHLDGWVQTAPVPVPDPDPAVFLRGPRSGVPDVQVVFRADLGLDPTTWADVVAPCPPTVAEAVPVRIDVFRRWLAGEDPHDESGDVEGEPAEQPEQDVPLSRRALRWRGPAEPDTGPLADAGGVRPNDTYVIPTTETGLDALGDFPTPVPADYGDEAFQRSRDRAILRLPDLDLDPDDEDFENRLTMAIKEVGAASTATWLKRAADHLADPRNRTAEPHPVRGWVVTGRRRLFQFDPAFQEDAESASATGQRPVRLDDHCRGVAAVAARYAAGCRLPADMYTLAGLHHDLGKLDPRFQALLQGRSPRTAAPPPLAKSGTTPASREEAEQARAVHRYPKGGRHELLSAALLAKVTVDDLLLHLVATHHGYARPFAPAVEENEFAARPFTATVSGQSVTLDSSAQTPTAWNAVLPDRFWRVVRTYGWWGAAYREAVFRLADQARSRAEQDDDVPLELSVGDSPALPAIAPIDDLRSVELTGLDGSNPLAFLAAVGTLRLADQAFDGRARLGWRRVGRWVPVLYVPIDNDELVGRLYPFVHRQPNADAAKNVKAREREYRTALKAVDAARQAVRVRRLRGPARDAAVAAEVTPLQLVADGARAGWLATLDAAAPAPFLGLGKALSVTAEEFRAFARRCADCLLAAGPNGRFDADFAPAFGSEACVLDSGRIEPTAFQLITGSGHQFFLETLAALLEKVTVDQLGRALFGPWTYADARLSFRWDPGDDRRYAYAWGDPSGEEVRTEHGANLLAAFALPLFPVVLTTGGCATTGFDDRTEPKAFTWPVWDSPVGVDAARSLLASGALRGPEPDRVRLRAAGASDLFRVWRIEVGRPPLSKLNFTASAPA